MVGFSFYLGAQAHTREIDFWTFDSVIHFNKPPPGFLKLDIFAEQEYIKMLIEKQPCALFCDNGNKPRELQTFAPCLRSDSIVVVHDWLDEIGPEDIPDYLEEIYGQFCDDLGSKSRVFRKKVE